MALTVEVGIQKVLATNVLQLRQKRGWTQEKLAEVAGLHRTYISQLETATRNPTVLVVERLAGALGVSSSELLKPVEEGEKQ